MNIKKNIKSVLWILLITIVCVVLLIPRKVLTENFEILRGYTSETLYRDLKDITKFDERSADISFMETIDDRSDELIMKRCYQIPTTIDYIIAQANRTRYRGARRTLTEITSNFTDVINKITLDIQTVHDTLVNGLIHGPIYVFVYQVPYYKNKEGQDISLQSFNVSSYNFQPSFDERNINGQQPIYYYVQIYYSRYDSDWKLTQGDVFKKSIMNEYDNLYASFEPQCYMVAAGTTTGPTKYAGCASSTASTNGMNTATCLGPQFGNSLLQQDKEDKKNTVSTYGILYTINMNAPTIKKFLFNKDSIEYPTKWQYLHRINVPVRLNKNKEVECLSDNSKKCLWRSDISLNDANSPDKIWQPLACGEMHKNLYGNTGYEKPYHWCAKSSNALNN